MDRYAVRHRQHRARALLCHFPQTRAPGVGAQSYASRLSEQSMPQRSNDFQKLILLLHQQLSPVGSRIGESNMVQDPDTGHLREVDITVEIDAGPEPLRLFIECRDHRRKQTVEWIEQLIGKHGERERTGIVAVFR